MLKIICFIAVYFIMGEPIVRGYKIDSLKKIIFENPEKIHQFYWSKFIRTSRMVADNFDYFLGHENTKENEEIIKRVFRENFLIVSQRYIQRAHDICSISDRVNDVLGKIEKFKSSSNMRRIFGEEWELKILSEDVILFNKDYFNIIISSYLESNDCSPLESAIDEFGVLRVVERYNLDKVKLSFVETLLIKASEKINEEIYA